MDADLNKYDLDHVTTAHPLMSKAEFEKVYADAWSRYYTLDHVETMMRRAAVSKISTSQVLLLSTWFMGALKIEGVHPLEVGWIRLEVAAQSPPRHEDRAGDPVLSEILCRTGLETGRWGWLYFRFGLRQLKVERDPDGTVYTDHAMTPVTDHEEQDFELFKTEDAQIWLNQEKRIDRARHGISEPADSVCEWAKAIRSAGQMARRYARRSPNFHDSSKLDV